MLCKVLKATPGLSVSTLRHSGARRVGAFDGRESGGVRAGISIGTGDFPSAPLSPTASIRGILHFGVYQGLPFFMQGVTKFSV